MKIILKDEVENLGEAGEIVEVADGYARNYLIPKGLAQMATREKVHEIRQKQKARERRKAEKKEQAEEIAEDLAAENFEISVKAGEQDRLFGSVTTQDIEELLAEAGYEVDRRDIGLDENIKELGEHQVPIKLFEDITAEVTINVTPLEDEDAEEE